MGKTNRDKNLFKHELSSQRHQKEVAKQSRRRRHAEARKKVAPQTSKASRRRSRIPTTVADWEELDLLDYEPVMPRGARERQRKVAQAAGNSRRASSPAAQEPVQPRPGWRRGLVVEAGSGLCRVALDGQRLLCRIRGLLSKEPQEFTNVVAVGDEVFVRSDGAGGGIVEAVLPRRSVLARPDVFLSHLRQVIVANADQLLIVASWHDPHIWLELIDRYLVAAERSNLKPILCVNKVDLADSQEELAETLAPYRQLGYQLLLTSAETGSGIAELRAVLYDRVTVLSGLSGVGKSSLLTAVQPSLQLRTGVVSTTTKHQGEGRHTTTQATLLQLDGGGAVIDTPGVREFGLSGLSKQELAEYFPEIAQLSSACYYANCQHLDEPECAVRAALAEGAVARSRYHSYCHILATLPA